MNTVTLVWLTLAAAPAPDGLVARWEMNDTTPEVVDSSGQANHGKATGETYFTTGGIVGGARQFDGRTGYVVVPDGPALRPQRLTISAWFALDRLPAERGVTLITKPQRKAPWAHPFLSWMIRINSARTIEAAIGTRGGYGGVFDLPRPIAVGQWHHVAMTYDGAELRTYFDGVAIGIFRAPGPIDYAPLPVLIGADLGAAPASDFFPGRIDQVAIWSRPLEAPEVGGLFALGAGAGATPRTDDKALQAEAFTGLKSLYTSEKAYFAERDRYTTNLTQIGFEPDGWCEDGARLRIKAQPTDFRKVGCHFTYEVETLGEGPQGQFRLYARGAVEPVLGVVYLVESSGQFAGIPRPNPK